MGQNENHTYTSNLSRRGFLAACTGAVALSGLILEGCNRTSGDLRNPGLSESDRFMVEERTLTQREQILLRAHSIAEKMSLEHKIAQLFVVRPEAIGGAGAVTQASIQLQDALRQWPVGGLIYFAQNLINEQQTKAMLDATLRYGLGSNGIPPFLCVDEEGGTVSRIGGAPGFDAMNVGDMLSIGAIGDHTVAKSAAIYISRYLKPLGFNVDFAPVCDIADTPGSTMRRRSFGSDPNLVAGMAQAQVEGFLENGILCCAKHFPGIGAVTGDSHDERIISNQSLEALRATELVPFVSTIKAGVPFVMAGHLSLPIITGNYTPASLSPRIIEDLLRKELGFDGLIITDSLGMAAVHEYYSVRESAALALKAGCDMVLLPAVFEEAFYGVLEAVANEELSEERINQSVRRIIRTKLEYFGGLFE